MQLTTMIPADPRNWDGKYGSYLQKIALSKLSDPDLARDLVQDTFLAGLEQLHYFKGNSTERTWLTGILLHKIFDFYRKRSMEKKKEPHIIKAQLTQQAMRSNEDLLIQKEFSAMIKLNISKLPQLWAAVFHLKYLDETPTVTICKQLEITSANFWTITHRSKIQLRIYLQNAALGR